MKAIVGGAILLVLLIHTANASEKWKPWPCPEVTNLVFYIHTNLTGENATDVVVAGQNGDLTTVQFGTVSVGDLILTEEQSEDSTQIGRLKITVLNADTTYVVYPHAHEIMTAVIETAQHNGTVAVNGRDIADGSELAVVGGTGDFQGVKGWANFTHVWSDGVNSITHVNATLLHPPFKWFIPDLNDLYEDDEEENLTHDQVPLAWSSY